MWCFAKYFRVMQENERFKYVPNFRKRFWGHTTTVREQHPRFYVIAKHKLSAGKELFVPVVVEATWT